MMLRLESVVARLKHTVFFQKNSDPIIPSSFLSGIFSREQIHGSQSPIRLLRVSRCLIKSFIFLTWFNLSN